jgi:hypothetical protein
MSLIMTSMMEASPPRTSLSYSTNVASAPLARVAILNCPTATALFGRSSRRAEPSLHRRSLTTRSLGGRSLLCTVPVRPHQRATPTRPARSPVRVLAPAVLTLLGVRRRWALGLVGRRQGWHAPDRSLSQDLNRARHHGPKPFRSTRCLRLWNETRARAHASSARKLGVSGQAGRADLSFHHGTIERSNSAIYLRSAPTSACTTNRHRGRRALWCLSLRLQR